MGKLVVIEIGDGDFNQGFPVTIRIGEDGCSTSTGEKGKLPPNSEIGTLYNTWKKNYRKRVRHPRISDGLDIQFSKHEIIQDGDRLKDSLNKWLINEQFRSIKSSLERESSKHEEIRVIIQTDSKELQQLPWHLWEVFKHYRKADVAFSPRTYTPVSPEVLSITKRKIKLLATFGDSAGEIDNKKDLKVLEQHLSKIADLISLVEPTTETLNARLRQEKPDIFFYAGHSSSQDDDQGCKIDKINFRYLESAFRDAVENGLKLAIFNSCDGLGIARYLTDLQIPQVIVMREPIPDPVAHKFLEYFIEEFSKRTPLHLALRKAREQLDYLEEEHPGATWLPVIFQDLTKVPPNWDKSQQPNQTWISRMFRRIGTWRTRAAGATFLAVVAAVAVLAPPHQQRAGTHNPRPAQPQVDSSQQATTVNQIAKNSTVLIDGKNPGSGVIFAKKGKTYYVITTQSVVDTNSKDKYNIVTSNTEQHPASVSPISSKLSGLDLAILQFNSDTDYNIARLGNSDKAIEGTAVYISGWSGIDGSDKPLYNFIEGKISSLNIYGLNKVSQNGYTGYTLIYNSNIREGMKGGSLLDKDGCVIGIHGRAEQEALRNLESAQIGLVKNGFNQGIPIKTFLERVSEPEIEKQLGQMEHCH